MDLTDFSFTETGDDLDVDIEETIRQQMLALEELDTTVKNENAELEPGFLPDMEFNDADKMNAVESFSLESLGSWQDLMKTMTGTDIAQRFAISLETSLMEEQSTNHMFQSVSNQSQQIIPEQSVAESVSDRFADISQVELEQLDTYENVIEAKNAALVVPKDKYGNRSVSLERKKSGRKSKIGHSLHNISKNDEITEEEVNDTKSLKKNKLSELGSFSKISSEKTRKSSYKFGSQMINVKKAFTKSVINLELDKNKSESFDEVRINQNVVDKPRKLMHSDELKMADIQPSEQPCNITEIAKEVTESKGSANLDIKESNSVPKPQLDDTTRPEDQIKAISSVSNSILDTECTDTVLESDILSKKEYISNDGANVEPPIMHQENKSHQRDEDIGGKIKNIEVIEKGEEEILQYFKKELEASKKRSIFLMREKGPVHLSSEELRQREIDKEKLVKEVQESLASYVEEYDLIRNSLISEMELQKDIKWQLENSKNRRRTLRAEFRTDRLFLVKQNEKVAAIGEWIMKDAMDIYKKEKERANFLLQKAAEFKLLEHKKQVTIKSSHTALLEQLNEERGKYITFLNQLREQSDDLEKKNQESVLEYEQLQLENNRLTELKLSRIEKRVANEVGTKIKENEVIDKALKKNYLNGEENTLSDLILREILNFVESDLKKIPYILKDAANLIYLDLSKNEITTIENLDYCKKLCYLNLNNNHLKNLDLVSLASPQRISAANNQISSVSSIPESVKVLDLSGNILVDLQAISDAINLYICIMKNTQVSNASNLSRCKLLLYLDLENCGLADMSVDYLRNCITLLYLNISNNLYTKIPSIPTLMLRQLDLSCNDIVALRLDSWLPMLKILRLNECKIQKMEPLWGCPFLEEIHLKNNLIQDVTCMAALTPCQDLRVIDLEGNPICKDYRLPFIFELFFKKSPKKKGEAASEIASFLVKPLKVIGILNIISKFLERFMTYGRDVDEKIAQYQSLVNTFKGVESKLIKVMGHYTEPFLKYLLGNFKEGIKRTATFESEDQCLLTTGSCMADLYNQISLVEAPSHDICLVQIMKRIMGEHRSQAILYTQALWRMKKQRIRYKEIHRSIILIQVAWKDIIYFRRPGKKGKAIRRQKALENKSAIKIQSLWRGYSHRKKSTERDVNGTIDQSLNGNDFKCVPLQDELEDVMMEEGTLDVWLKSVNENEYDEKMDSYLSSEKLVHFKDEPVIGHAIAGVEISSQSLDKYNGAILPIRHPYNPVEIIMIGQRRITPKSMGRAKFIPPDDVTRTYESTFNAIPENSLSTADKSSDIISYPEESSIIAPKNEMLSIKRLYESLGRKGFMDNNNRPESSFMSEGISEWREHDSLPQNNVADLKKKSKPRNQREITDHDIDNPFKSRCSSGKALLTPIIQKTKSDDPNVVYAWDPQNQSLSTKLRLEKLNKTHAPIFQQNIHCKPTSPIINASRIPLINNYLFTKMFGKKTQKLTEIQKNP